MKYLLTVFLVLCLCSPVLATKVWDTPLREDLTDDVASTAGAISRTSSATYINSSGVLTTATANTARIGYDGILREGPGQNDCLQSEDLFTTWTKAGLTTAGSNATTAPDGAETADAMIEDTSNGLHQRYQTITITSGQSISVSTFAKANTRTKLEIVISNGGSYFFYDFDLSAGTVGAVTNAGAVFTNHIATIIPVGNNWYRCHVGADTTGVTSVIYWLRLLNGAGTSSYVGDGSSLYVWGMSLERGYKYMTSYIPTTTAPVARTTEAADAADVGYSWTTPAAVTTILSGSVDGTLVFDWTPHYDEADGTGTVSIISWDDSTTSGVYTTHGSDLNITDGTNTATVTLAWVANQTYPIAVYWDTGNSDLKIGWFGAGVWTWGATVDFDGDFAVTDGKIKLGYGNAYPFSIKGIRFYDEDLTDTDPAVTVSANNMTYRNQLYNGENCYEGIHINNGVTGTLIQNCTFVNFNGPALNTLADVTVENCLFFENLGDIEITTGDTVTGNNNALEDWNVRGAGTYTDTDSIFSNLDAVADREAGNFRLKRGNAAIDAGKDLSGTYTTDINSLPWERGAGFDIGCYSRFWYNANMGTPLKINGEDPGYIYKYNGDLSTNAP